MDWLADQILIFEILVSPYLKDGLQEESDSKVLTAQYSEYLSWLAAQNQI